MGTSPLCIVGELEVRGSVAVAVCVDDMWQVTHDMGHTIILVSVLLSAHVARLSVSCILDFSSYLRLLHYLNPMLSFL